MKWKYKHETRYEKALKLGQWHFWFAWYPVFYLGDAFFFEIVRRRYLQWDNNYMGCNYEYKSKNETL